jgi:insulysin
VAGHPSAKLTVIRVIVRARPRPLQLDKSTADPTHVYSKFGTGSVTTLWDEPKVRRDVLLLTTDRSKHQGVSVWPLMCRLLVGCQAAGIDTRSELLKFHATYYSANIMSLVVVGKYVLRFQNLTVTRVAGG